MRRRLRAVLFTCILGCGIGGGSLTAGDLSTAQAQQLVSAAQAASPGGKPVEATMAIDGKSVVFTVVRDAVGNVIARPVPGPDSAGISISQVSIQMRANAAGVLTPTSMVVVAANQTIASYSLQLNPDGSIASLYQAGSFAAGGGVVTGAQPVVGGIGGAGGPLVTGTGPSSMPADRYPGFTSGQLALPAGAGTGEVSHSKP
jgi:hypothetical protein